MARVLPVLFNTEMTRAILDGRKTVTRRIMKLPNYIKRQEDGGYTLYADGTCYENQCFEQIISYLKKPCQPGDILYVRETWNHYKHDIVAGTNKGYHEEGYFYKASPEQKDTLLEFVRYHWGEKWRPSIHMPKEAARIWLKVTGVRAERLKDTTPKDAWKEGAMCNCMSPVPDCAGNKTEYIKIWNSTLKKPALDRYGWDANPWVWVITFERCEKPEPCVLKGMVPAQDKKPCIGYGISEDNDELWEAREKQKEIEDIVNRQLIAGKDNYKEVYSSFYDIVKVVQQ